MTNENKSTSTLLIGITLGALLLYSQNKTKQYTVNSWNYHENSSDILTNETVHTAPGEGLSIYVTDIVFSTGTATACNVSIKEDVLTILGPYYLEPVSGRGLAIHLMTPKKCTTNTTITATTSAAIEHSLDITGFIAP